MSDPTLRSSEADPALLLAGQRASARAHVARMLAGICEAEASCHFLMALDCPSAKKLREALQEVYGHAGNVLAELAPWRDPELSGDQEQASPRPVVVPGDEEEDEHAAAV